MQAVIQKLREQEKELAALHRRDRERAQQTERLSEAVTRNMPAGLLLISSAGLVTSANPAAEAALDVHALAYRRYVEVLGKEKYKESKFDVLWEQLRKLHQEYPALREAPTLAQNRRLQWPCKVARRRSQRNRRWHGMP